MSFLTLETVSESTLTVLVVAIGPYATEETITSVTKIKGGFFFQIF